SQSRLRRSATEKFFRCVALIGPLNRSALGIFLSLTRALTRAATKIKTVDSFRRVCACAISFNSQATLTPTPPRFWSVIGPPLASQPSPWRSHPASSALKIFLRIPKASEAFAQNQNANAIRWGILYNFRFDADQPPDFGSA